MFGNALETPPPTKLGKDLAQIIKINTYVLEMLYSFSLNLCISLSLTFTGLTLNLKIKRVSFDLDSNKTSNMTQKRPQIHHDYHYYIKHYAL